MARVTKIPATISRYTAESIGKRTKRKTAGYARVSTELEEQQSSYESQLDYYTNFIKAHNDWEFVGMYSDEGITGTSTKKREGFNRMVRDAIDGKIDLIITKSVSRFARNTVDSLSTIRKLKEHGTEIFFEKENIWTFDAKGELLITIMSSLAQEESRNISENTTWGKRKQFADGKVSMPFKYFLGYDRGPNGELVVNEEQAKVVKLIYRLFLSGLSCPAVGRELERRGIKSPQGKDKWSPTTVRSILSNEKYKGDALLQKSYTKDFLTKKKVKNNGEIPQYYVENDHEAIISREVFDLAQAELEKRSRYGTGFSGATIFSSKIKCGECGSWYGHKVWHSNDKSRKDVFQCNDKYHGDTRCSTPHVTEAEIRECFVTAFNRLIEEKDEVVASMKERRSKLRDNGDLKKQAEALKAEMEVKAQMLQSYIDENARIALNQEEYNEKYNGLVNAYEEVRDKYEAVKTRISDNRARAKLLEYFIKTISRQKRITEFDDSLWSSFVDYVTVYSKDYITVTFRDGTEIKAN